MCLSSSNTWAPVRASLRRSGDLVSLTSLVTPRDRADTTSSSATKFKMATKCSHAKASSILAAVDGFAPWRRSSDQMPYTAPPLSFSRVTQPLCHSPGLSGFVITMQASAGLPRPYYVKRLDGSVRSHRHRLVQQAGAQFGSFRIQEENIFKR